MEDMKPFKISVPVSELEILNQKLSLTRIPTNLANAEWIESSENNVSIDFLSSTLKFWRESYSWPDEEALLNNLPQFKTTISVSDYNDVTVQFVHSPSSNPNSIPLLFFHGWPGSIIEISKALPLLNNAAFHVVAPSLPGWLSSTSPTKKGFHLDQCIESFHKLMLKLGYQKYVVQGGDWGGHLGRTHATKYPEHVLGLHVNHFPMSSTPKSISANHKYSPFEERSIKSFQHWLTHETAYQKIQGTKPLTFGVGLHDSPVGMLAWMADKLFSWSDCYPKNPKGYKWTSTEIITWTLIHYFGEFGPTAPFRMYVEHGAGGGAEERFISVPTGVSAFAAEVEMVPRGWAETRANIVFWREHEIGGHFAMYECPEATVGDIVDFVETIGLRKSL